MRLTALFVAASLAGVVYAQETPTTASGSQGAKQQPPADATPDKSQNTPAGIHNAREKLSYSLGVDLAYRLRWQHVDVDLELLVKGLQDAFAKDDGQLLIPAKQAALTVKQFQAQRKRGLEHAMGVLSQKNKAAGATFVAENAKKDGVVTLPSGLQYRVLKAGDGRKPTLEDDVQCHYRGTLVDGTEFDSSDKRGEPATFPLSHSIKGWQEALQLMPVGSRWQIVVPPQLAYGERGSGSIGPDATLLFEMELVSIPEKAKSAGTSQAPPAKPDSGS